MHGRHGRAVYVGLAFFLTGSGLNVTCINMMLTQRFTPEDPRREGAFLWNYADERRFFIGFTVAGYFQGRRAIRPLHSRRSAISSPSYSPCSGGGRWPIAIPRCSMRRRSSSGAAARRHADFIGVVPVVAHAQRPGTETLIKGSAARSRSH
jgi:hypothetical protein